MDLGGCFVFQSSMNFAYTVCLLAMTELEVTLLHQAKDCSVNIYSAWKLTSHRGTHKSHLSQSAYWPISSHNLGYPTSSWIVRWLQSQDDFVFWTLLSLQIQILFYLEVPIVITCSINYDKFFLNSILNPEILLLTTTNFKHEFFKNNI